MYPLQPFLSSSSNPFNSNPVAIIMYITPTISTGIKIWLPLHPLQEGGNKGFMSKRIMLPFHVDIYPIGIVVYLCRVVLRWYMYVDRYTYMSIDMYVWIT